MSPFVWFDLDNRCVSLFIDQADVFGYCSLRHCPTKLTLRNYFLDKYWLFPSYLLLPIAVYTKRRFRNMYDFTYIKRVMKNNLNMRVPVPTTNWAYRTPSSVCLSRTFLLVPFVAAGLLRWLSQHLLLLWACFWRFFVHVSIHKFCCADARQVQSMLHLSSMKEFQILFRQAQLSLPSRTLLIWFCHLQLLSIIKSQFSS